jgi:3',5'-nucleoside bisphosphate phosphatase
VNPIDLHCHTYYSDGRFSPAEVIEYAAQNGIAQIAITDHDNTGGYREALPLANVAGIDLIPGIEFTTRWDGAGLPPEDVNVDLLGYWFNPDDIAFRAFMQASLADVHERIDWACQYLTDHGCPIRMEEVFAENPRYGGMVQMIYALIHKGIAANWPVAVNQYIEPAWELTRLPRFSIQETIATIHAAGGVAVLAHPAVVRPQGQQMTSRYLKALVEAGLDGIEIYHRRLNEAAQAHFLGLAREFDLAISGGSDMHGWNKGLEDLGSQPVSGEMVERLKASRPVK